MYTIYKHTNKINGKSYIGQTKRPLSTRFGINGENYIHSVKFYAAIQKYGWDNFEHSILEENLTAEEVDLREQYWIKFYDSINNGYNLLSGGNHQEVKLSTKEKQRNSQLSKCEENRQLYGTGLKPSAIKKLSDMYRGKHFAGIDSDGHLLDYIKKKISATQKLKLSEKVICPICGKSCSKPYYNRHMKIHDKEKS